MLTTVANNYDALSIACKTISIEIDALQAMRDRLDHSISQAVEIIMATQGRVVVIGMGKSGIIGQKIAATLASTGTSAFFVHPGEAFHGDLGMIKPVDVALLISNSGETEEILRILPFLEHQGNKIIALTGKLHSSLARHSHVVLDVGVSREACRNNLAPTSSTTTTLVMGDALAVALTEQRGFEPEDFARFHPGGSLGRRLLTKVRDVMHKPPLPICTPEYSFRDVVNVITNGRLGMALVIENEKLLGIITDGDIRRAFDTHENVKQLSAQEMMTPDPLSIGPDVRFADAEAFMREKKVSTLVVKNDSDCAVGILHIYDLNHSKPQL
ncbi:hypothetical protein AAV94_08885 [Lampropedia cohaerens]|uniref:Arabinose 5-phosphate isomerase n=1 Tax=Lampropedia cohaerens TaxID=1610491 RepID=A0A0U1PZ33_9BURK|nr:KpsF/GutQ family sugar-phosphate isomerase [Lampropedia cohaerens]KKW67737.1 hypothetical protein AAV94_08885 [Lampropedia cohaerens]